MKCKHCGQWEFMRESLADDGFYFCIVCDAYTHKDYKETKEEEKKDAVE